jgi:hypothetical protein
MWSAELGYGVRPPEHGQVGEVDEPIDAAPLDSQHAEARVEIEHGTHGGSGGHDDVPGHGGDH